MHRPSALRLRSVLTLTLALPLPLSACDGGDKSDAKADAKAEDNKADAKAEEKKAEEPKKEEPKEKKLENTWDADSVKEALRGGVVLNYKQTGTDAKGKAVEDDYRCEVKKSSGTEVGTVCDGVNHPSKDKGATQVAMQPWSAYSPFFGVQNPTVELQERADLTVAAGTFDTVKMDLKGFFGNHYTVWMIADKPGIYAKVEQHPNAGTEDDKTALVYELASIEAKGG